MMDPGMGLYGSAAAMSAKGHYSAAEMKHSLVGSGGDSSGESSVGMNNANFNDFDDDSSNYYTRKASLSSAAASMGGKRKMAFAAPAFPYGFDEFSSRSDDGLDPKHTVGSRHEMHDDSVSTIDEKESIDETQRNEITGHLRVKRQIYMSSHEEQEGPCYGFPLEVNVKSRIKLDRIFPIHGKSQYKKCIKVG